MTKNAASTVHLFPSFCKLFTAYCIRIGTGTVYWRGQVVIDPTLFLQNMLLQIIGKAGRTIFAQTSNQATQLLIKQMLTIIMSKLGLSGLLLPSVSIES